MRIGKKPLLQKKKTTKIEFDVFSAKELMQKL
jgi:hypothetical protein